MPTFAKSTSAGESPNPPRMVSALAPLARMAKTAAAQIARSKLLMRASSNTNAHKCVRFGALRRLFALRFPPESNLPSITGPRHVRLTHRPTHKCGMFFSVLTNPKMVNSMLLKYPSHRVALWMNTDGICRARTLATLAEQRANGAAREPRGGRGRDMTCTPPGQPVSGLLRSLARGT